VSGTLVQEDGASNYNAFQVEVQRKIGVLEFR